MKTSLYTTIALVFSAFPALAHSGAHLHPHGSEGLMASLLLVAVVAAGASLAVVRARKK